MDDAGIPPGSAYFEKENEVDRKIISLVLVAAAMLLSFFPRSAAYAGESADADVLGLQIVFGTSYSNILPQVRGAYRRAQFFQHYTCSIGGDYYSCDVYVLLGNTLGFGLVIQDDRKIIQVDIIEAGEVKPIWEN